MVGQAIILLSLGGWKYPFGGPGWVLPGGGSLGSHLFGVRASNSFLGGVRMVQASCLQAEKNSSIKKCAEGRARALLCKSLSVVPVPGETCAGRRPCQRMVLPAVSAHPLELLSINKKKIYDGR